MSVMERATRLRAIAHTYAEGAKERRDREQAAIALKDVEEALDALLLRADAARAAAGCGVQLPDVSGIIERGLTNLEAKARDGLLPTKQALQAARGKLANNRTELEAALGTAWREWASARIAEVPVGKAALLSDFSRQSVEEDLRSLSSTARALPSAIDVESFSRKLTRVRAALDALESDEGLVELLGRLNAPEGIVLSDLSDDEVALLRQTTAIADQIVLRRR